MERIGVIIVAGGSGCRMGSALPKQFMLLGGEPVLARTINTFAAALPGAAIVVVLPETHKAFWRDLAARFEVARHTVATGGAERFHSVSSGLAALPPDAGLIAVHDGVRPLVSAGLIRRMAAAAAEHGAAIPVTEPADSFRETDSEGSHVIDRRRLRAVQTPQVFRAELLRRAYETTYSPAFTDDATVAEHAGATVFLAAGERRNIKITTSEDLLIAEALLADDAARGARNSGGETTENDEPQKGSGNAGGCGNINAAPGTQTAAAKAQEATGVRDCAAGADSGFREPNDTPPTPGAPAQEQSGCCGHCRGAHAEEKE